MNSINLNNYEAFVLDYIEGRLNKEEREALMQFVLLHPELNLDLEADLPSIENDVLVFQSKEHLKREFSPSEEELLNYLENTMPEAEKLHFEQKLEKDAVLASELNAFQKTKLVGESELHFEFKNSLIKQEDDLYLNNPTLQYLEGELNNEAALTFEKELALNPLLREELALYRKTKLEADNSLVFENKAALKKETLVLPLFSARVVFSAAAAILFLVFFGFVLNSFLNPVALPQHKTAVASVSPKTPGPTKEIKNQAEPTIEIQSPKIQSGLAVHKINHIKNATSDSLKETSAQVLAENKALVDTLSKPFMNGVNTASLALEKENAPLPAADKESLEKLEYAYLIPFEEDEDEDQDASGENNTKTKRGFWSFATRMAKKANQIGIKSINGSEDGNNNYLLSFNSMTIEKK
ncbi:MAG: hypothetical protein JNK73_10995 [Bacteroidia bacterium]|nr:hypothetical protein [Bacteroidia bacterium]